MSDYNSNNMIMDWDDALENDGQEYVVLEEGDYNFTVTGFERGRFPGSAKIPPCNKASLTLTVALPDGRTAFCKEDLILYRTLEWKLASFFRAIGVKKSGESVAMDWDKVPGARGRAHFKPRAYSSGGVTHTVNAVDRYYDHDSQTAEPDWVLAAEQAVLSGTVRELPARAAYAPQQTRLQNGGA